MPALGFLNHAHAYRPDLEHWPTLFYEGCLRATEWGLRLHSRLVGALAGLNEFAPPLRSTSHLPQLAELLIERVAVAAADVAEALSLTPHGARALLLQLRSRGLIQEVTGRRSFRLFAV
jgi:Fic family protein